MSRSTQRRCLVTGGAGFIGSHLAETLVARGDHVVIVDNLSTGRRSNLRNLTAAQHTFIHATVSDALRDFAPGEFDEIYHLAAAVGVRLVIERPIHTIETNVLESIDLLRFAAAAKTRTLIASTSEVYGKGSRTPFAEDDDVVYGPTTLNRWSYACSKAIDEYLALAHSREESLPVVIVRFFNTVGPRQVGEYGMVLPRFVSAALAGAPLEVHGDGRQSRCFCDVRDSAPALPALLASPACHGRVLNLGDDKSIQIRDLAELVKSTLGSHSPIRLVPYDEAFGKNFDDLRDRRPDLSRVRHAIGFQARIPLAQTIRDLADELREAAATPASAAPHARPVEAPLR
ncbi:MAG TPA: NAD-dependent epimerase/dehydratase family protein [Phycisphaerales bacterium]|nr:NAD-dependent epimerase/dehydratase family protein [Phycisphaerales bacterium]